MTGNRHAAVELALPWPGFQKYETSKCVEDNSFVFVPELENWVKIFDES